MSVAVRAERLAGGIVAVAAFVLAWLVTGPEQLLGMNWDTCSDIAALASQQHGWSSPPWSSHFAIVQLYLVGYGLLRPLGLTLIESYRAVNALSFAIAAGLVAWTSAHLGRSAIVGTLLGLVFASAWGEQVLVRTLEDNVLFMPASAGVLALGCMRADDWRARDSLVAGALVAYGRLMSWQAIVYLVPALWVAVVLGARRSRAMRLRDGALVVAAFFVCTFAWLTIYWLSASGLSFAAVFGAGLFSRPDPSFFPRNDAEWRDLASIGSTLYHLGFGIGHEVGPSLRDSRWLAENAHVVGAIAVGICSAIAAAGTYLSWRLRSARLHFLALMLLTLTLATSLYHDLLADKFKRYEYLPLLLTLLAAAAWGALPDSQRVRRVALVPLTALLGLLVGVQLGVAGVWNRAWHEQQARGGYYGYDGVSWYGWVHRLRTAHADACQFVFAESELRAGRYNYESIAAIWSELPEHLVLGLPSDVGDWRYRLRWTPAGGARSRLRSCAWLTPPARQQLRR